MLGLWSDQHNKDAPSLLWTLDESGWIFELRITNPGLLQYHGYPIRRTVSQYRTGARPIPCTVTLACKGWEVESWAALSGSNR